MKTNPLPFAFPLDSSDIIKRRARILAYALAIDPGFCQIPAASLRHETLQEMLRMYDRLFFEQFLERSYAQIELSLSGRLTSSAGKFIFEKKRWSRQGKAEIRMSSDFLFRLESGPFNLNGLSVSTPQEAFLVVFEHELCHAAEYALYGQTGHSDRFRSIAFGLFGHRSTTHSLPTRKQEAAVSGFRVGSQATFPYEGSTLSGTITYIGKTATVMVPSRTGDYRDSKGRRYDKYRVPINQLSH